MSLLGEGLRYFGPEPIDPKIQAEHDEINLTMYGLHQRMLDLAPNPRRRLSLSKKPRHSAEAFYRPEEPNDVLGMYVWLETSKATKDEGPVVRLYTKSLRGEKFLDNMGRTPICERATAYSLGRLVIHDCQTGQGLSNRELQLLRFDSAMNILNEVRETVELLAPTSEARS